MPVVGVVIAKSGGFATFPVGAAKDVYKAGS
jgi:hypothetical protein